MISAFLAVATLLGPTQQDTPVFSGPQPGEKLVPFSITGAIGDEAGKSFDVVVEAGGKPVVLVFVHERTRPAFALANAVGRLVADRDSATIAGGLVYLDDDPTEAGSWMNRVSQHFPDRIRKGVSPDGKEGPGAYGLNRNVAVTVLVAKDSIVTANFALVQPSLEVDAPKIFKAIASVLGEKTVPDVAKYARGYRADDARMRRGTATSGQQDPALRGLLSPLIQKDATEEQVTAAAQKIEDYAARHPAARTQIGDIARRIIAAERLRNYGTKACQDYLKKWASEFTGKPPSSEAESSRGKDRD